MLLRQQERERRESTMNREKKQMIVVGVLVALVLSVGAFQFTRKDPVPVAQPKVVKPEPTKPGDKDFKMVPLKYPELIPLAVKDPFETASFAAGPKPIETPPVETKTQVPGTAITKPTRDKLTKLPPSGDFAGDKTFTSSGIGEVKPQEVPEPIFGYTLIGIVEGAYPAAVFEDGKGNQQLVEVGQGIGPSATILSISRGKVRVQFNARTLNLNVGGNPNAK